MRLCSAAFIDYKAGGQVAEMLAKVPEYEVTLPNAGDKLIMSAEVQLTLSIATTLQYIITYDYSTVQYSEVHCSAM